MTDAESAWDFSFETLDGKPLPLSSFKGKAMLVVNTASQCGFTAQYKGLESLSKKYRDKGLVVLGVPCNDFGGQEPGTATDIAETAQHQYGASFPITAKAEVRGPNSHPFYKWAIGQRPLDPPQKGGAPFALVHAVSEPLQDGGGQFDAKHHQVHRDAHAHFE